MDYFNQIFFLYFDLPLASQKIEEEQPPLPVWTSLHWCAQNFFTHAQNIYNNSKRMLLL